MKLRRFLRHPNAVYAPMVLMALGVVFLFCSMILLAIVFLFIGLMMFAAMYHQDQVSFWRSQTEWWDDQEWEAWQRGEDVPEWSETVALADAELEKR